MRYLKVLLLVILFFLVMLFFVQNQSSFADPVVLKLDLMFMPIMESMPLPLYAIMLMCFTFGGLLVLAMLLWDRLSLSARCSSAKMKASGLEKRAEKAEKAIEKVQLDKENEAKKYQEEIKKNQEEIQILLDRIARKDESKA